MYSALNKRNPGVVRTQASQPRQCQTVNGLVEYLIKYLPCARHCERHKSTRINARTREAGEG